MIIVTLRTGQQVEIKDGLRADFIRTTKRVDSTVEEVVATTLDVRDNESSYSGKVIACFKADEVVYFTVDEQIEE